MSVGTVTISIEMLNRYKRHGAIFEQLKKEYEMAEKGADTEEVKKQQKDNREVFYSHLSDAVERVDSLANKE